MIKTIIEKPSEKQNNLISDLLLEYNANQPGYVKTTEYQINYYDESNILIGGTNFEIDPEWIFIDILFVREDLRVKGYGKQFLIDAEDFAKSKGCTKSILNSSNYQAPEFYMKYGYVKKCVQEYKDSKSNSYCLMKVLV
jgi:GNAT superfamily N-acetyltransferase